MKRTLTGVLLPFICYCTALANVVVSGKVVSTTEETLPALVTALEGNAIKGYCSANDDGNYSVYFESSSPKKSKNNKQ